jgi:hypothetical protein
MRSGAPYAAIVIGTLVVAAESGAQVQDPDLVWRTIRTSRFDIHYHEPLGELAQEVATVAHRVDRGLRERLGYGTDERVQIVVSDHTDTANGRAGVIPRNVIRLFVGCPEDLSPLSDYDDWLTQLVSHEHTHILHLNQIGGIPAVINSILGKTYAPNQAQPRWFTEGLATYQESVQTSGGRLRSSIFDMYLRMDALENRQPRLDQLSSEARRWPHGTLPYLYGARFINYIAETYGRE